MTKINCYCGSDKSFQECCEPYIKGIKQAETSEILMRSRYSAYAIHAIDYLVATTHVLNRNKHSRKDILDWAISNQWQKLEIIKATENTVEFKAYFLDNTLSARVHHEKSTFKSQNDAWYYVDGVFY